MKKARGINRREFLSLTAGMGVAAACPSLLAGCGDPSDSRPLPSLQPSFHGHGVSSAWIDNGDPESQDDLFRAAVEAATDFSWLSRGDRVLLKLALNSGNPFPATTDPWALRCMVRILQERGAGEILAGDQSGVEHVFHAPTWGWGASRECCRTAGLLDVIEACGATPCFFEERGYDAYRQTLPPAPHHWDEPMNVTTALDDVDHIIHMPRVGAHIMAGRTLAMKIVVGFLRDDSRVFFHVNFGTFQEMYEEINHVPEIASKVRLAVTSGRAVMTTGGPDQGEVLWPDHGLVLASEDLLAHDLLAAAWLEATRTAGAPEDIRAHPAIVNWAERIGGMPESIRWSRINEHPDASVTVRMENLLRG